MFIDWIHWLSSLHPEQLLTFAWGLLIVDGFRYGFAKVAMCLIDIGGNAIGWLRGALIPDEENWVPTVGVILAGYNEAETIEGTLQSIWGTYPRLEIVVVDDGSEDGMAERAQRFARGHQGVLVLRRPRRGGKSSAMNFALQYLHSEVVVVVDADSGLGPQALWRIIQPLRDPRVGAVAGTVLGRQPFVNLVSWLQAYEYLSSIFVGRMLAARFGMLGIVSGAFGAFRSNALGAAMGWDVGPPEDLDLTLTLRKAGYRIASAARAICFTDLPMTWYALARQRMRWDQSGVIRNHCRKHLDLACFWRRNLLWSDFFLMVESWLTNIVCLIGIWAWIVWLCFHWTSESWLLLFSLYACYVALEFAQALVILFYSDVPGHDTLVCLVVPIVPLYQLFLMLVRTWALVRETFFRSSFHDNYVPRHVREATWHW
jgi:poly-beta-1,6-N-acetyl-D-glucosamine synthase